MLVRGRRPRQHWNASRTRYGSASVKINDDWRDGGEPPNGVSGAVGSNLSSVLGDLRSRAGAQANENIRLIFFVAAAVDAD